MVNNQQDNDHVEEVHESPEATVHAVVKVDGENRHHMGLYASAASLSTLTKDEQKALSAPFDDEDYEIRPDGHIYVPQALIRKRLNDIIGASEWAVLLIKDWTEKVGDKGASKVYYDGSLFIRKNFISRSIGEGNLSANNGQTSSASALESAKSDCISRCVKDLGVGQDIYMPNFQRKWKKKFAIRVKVNETYWNNGSSTKKVVMRWRRNDVDPLENETGLWETEPTVPPGAPKDEVKIVTPEWNKRLSDVKTAKALTSLYNTHKDEIDGWVQLKQAFKAREFAIKNPVK